MILKKEQLVDIYKKFNSLSNHSSNPIEIKENSFDFIEILADRNNNYNEEEKNNAFTSYIAIELFNFYHGKNNYLNSLYANNPDDEFGNETKYGQLDDSSVFQAVDNEYMPTDEQISALKEYVLKSVDRINEIDSISEDGKYVDSVTKSNYSEKDLKIDEKYNVEIDKKDALLKYNSMNDEEHYNVFTRIFDKHGSLFSSKALSDIDFPELSNNITYTKVVNDVNKNLRSCDSFEQEKAKNDRKRLIEDDLKNDLNQFYGLKAAIKKKEGTIGRYLNPFNWVRTYKTNKAVKELKERLTNKYNLTKNEWKFLDEQHKRGANYLKAKKYLKNEKDNTIVNLKDDQVYQEKNNKENRIVEYQKELISDIKKDFDRETKIGNSNHLNEFIKQAEKLKDISDPIDESEEETDINNVSFL